MCVAFMRLSYWTISVATRQGIKGRFWTHWQSRDPRRNCGGDKPGLEAGRGHQNHRAQNWLKGYWCMVASPWWPGVSAMPGWSLKVTPSLLPNRPADGEKKIDPLMALFNTVSLMSWSGSRNVAVLSINLLTLPTIMNRCGGFYFQEADRHSFRAVPAGGEILQ